MPLSLAKVYLIIDDKEYQRKFVESIINLKTKIITLLILVFIRSYHSLNSPNVRVLLGGTT